MRDVLFRGLASAAGFVYGHLFTEELPSGETYAAIVKEIDGRWRNVVVNENTVGQFTGLTDANGVKIFEGDIIEDEEHYYHEISWDSDDCMFIASDAGALADLCHPVKIIGNTHQNPELLK